LIENPKFESSDGWELQRGAVIESEENALVFRSDASASGARASQSIPEAEQGLFAPFELTVTYEVSCTTGCPLESPQPVAMIGEKPKAVNPDELWVTASDLKLTESMCVGESIYGSDFALLPGALPGQNFTETTTRTTIHSVNLSPADAGRCPDNSSVANGDFEQPLSKGWRVTPSDASAGVVEREGNRVLEVPPDLCREGGVRQLVSIPSDDATAIQYEVDVNGDTDVGLELSGFELWPGWSPSLTRAYQTEGMETRTVCVPNSKLGTIHPLEVRALKGKGAGRECSEAGYVDNLRFVERSACEQDSLRSGEGFESEPRRNGWVFAKTSRGVIGNVATESTESGSNHYARLPTTDGGDCRSGSFGRRIQLPVAPSGSSSYALQFEYRTQNVSLDDAVELRLGKADFSKHYPPSESWSTGTACLPTPSNGHRMLLYVLLDARDNDCDPATGTAPELHVDDFELVRSSECGE
jgi:hypothetical protein